MSKENSTTDLIKIDEVKSLVSQAPQMLQENEKSHSGALKYGNSLIETATKTGMTPELDKNMASYIKRLTKTKAAMNDRRKPFTQITDILKKRFTSLENDLLPSSEIVSSIKKIRDKYVTDKINAQKKIEEDARVKQEKEMEVVQITSDYETAIRLHYTNYVSFYKLEITKKLTDSELAVIDDVNVSILGYSEVLSKQVFDSVKFENTYAYHEADKVKELIGTVDKAKLIEEFEKDFTGEIGVHKKEVIDKIPTKKNELTEIDNAKTKKAQDALIKKQAAQKLIEDEKLAKEKKDKETLVQENVEVKAAGEKAKVMTSHSAKLFVEVQSKTVYEINVTDNSGYVAIFQYWFEKVGRKLDKEKFEKMTLKRMIEYAEKCADSSRIQSLFIEYKEKHVAR